VLTVQCPCGHVGRFAHRELQRKHRMPSDSLIADLQIPPALRARAVPPA